MDCLRPIALTAALTFGGFCFAFAPARADAPPKCKVPSALTDLGEPLPNTSDRLAAGEPIAIVTLGSSSTAGAGASSPAATYPSQLAVNLAARYPDARFTVLNRGVNGQESGEMLARLKTDVLAERPALVIWQLGTNSVLRDHTVSTAAENIEAGVAQIRETGADAILIDPQFVPRVIVKPEAEGMVNLINAAARKLKVGLFRRFSVMRYWHDVEGLPFEAFTSADGLHQNDWSYACWAKLLSAAIAQGVSRPALSAGIGPKARSSLIKAPTD